MPTPAEGVGFTHPVCLGSLCVLISSIIIRPFLKCNGLQIYLEASPIVFSVVYSQGSEYGIATLPYNPVHLGLSPVKISGTFF